MEFRIDEVSAWSTHVNQLYGVFVRYPDNTDELLAAFAAFSQAQEYLVWFENETAIAAQARCDDERDKPPRH